MTTAKKKTTQTETDSADMPDFRDAPVIITSFNEQYDQLTKPFPAEVERTLNKGGASLTYIPVSEVITRLNKVLGVGMWDYSIIKCERDSLDPDFIVAHVSLDARVGGSRVTRDGIGGQKIKRTKNGDIVDLGDEMKGAVSDALKKAAQTLGIGLYLARTEEAMEAEAVASIDPEVENLWDTFMNHSKALDAEKRLELNKFWNQYSNNAPKPTKTSATKAQLNALITECVRLALDATVEIDAEADFDE